MGNGLSRNEVDAIRHVTNECLSEIASGDFDDWLTHWISDARLMPPNAADVVGHEALRKWIYERPPVKTFSVFDMDIDGGGDVAIVIAHFSRAFASDNGDETDQAARQVLKFRRDDDGNWKICAAIFNSCEPRLKSPGKPGDPHTDHGKTAKNGTRPLGD